MSTHPTRAPRPTLATCVMGMALMVMCLEAIPADAAAPVFDPTNLVQNTSSAVSNATTAENSIQQKTAAFEQLAKQKEALRKQAEQLALELRNIQKLDVRSLRDMARVFGQVEAVINRRLGWMGMGLVELAQGYVALYSPKDASEHSGRRFEDDRTRWAQNVEDRYRANVEWRALAHELKTRLYAQARGVDGASQSVDGQLAATELNTKAVSVGNGYHALMLEAYLTHTEAEQLAELERRRLRQAGTTRLLNALGRGMGTYQSTARPVVLKDF